MDRLRRQQVFERDGYPVAGGVVVLESAVPSHTHDFLEVAVLLSGEVTYISPTGPLRLAAGAVSVVRPGGWHGYADATQAVIGNLYLGEELLYGDLRWLLDIGDLGRFLLRGGLAPDRLDPGALAVIRSRLQDLHQVSATRASASVVRAVGLCCAVLGELAEVRLDDSVSPALSLPVRRLLDLVGSRPAHPWTMSELSTMIGVSPSHLHRAFRAQLGMPPMTWLTRSRAELAASLLLQTDRPVGWVGRQVGWPDVNYFSRRFRRAYQMSPSEYRRRNR